VSHLTRTAPSRTVPSAGIHPAGAHLPATARPVADPPVRTGHLAPVARRVATTVPPVPTGAVVAPLPRPVLAIVPTDRTDPTDQTDPTGPTGPIDPIDRGAPAVAAVTSSAPPRVSSDDGSLVAEYGLLAVVAATVAGVLISWASSGALASFFGQLLDHARSLVVS
jgi:hypothetical protein